MDSKIELISGRELAFEEWRYVLRSACGQYNPEGVEPKAFAGSVNHRNICGFDAVDLSCSNTDRIERTQHDARSDGMEHFYALIPLVGRSTVIQNDHIAEVGAGDISLIDSTRPVKYVCNNTPGRWLSLHLPRQSLISHLGFEPQAGSSRRGGTVAARLFNQLATDAVNDSSGSYPPEPYMQQALYDLLGALFAGADSAPFRSHTDKLFTRVRRIIKSRFTDPDLGPFEVAAEAGISLRYLQKLFTSRGATCSHFIQSLRLDHAAQLVRRRTSMKSPQPLSEIAYTCGFRDYTNFARAFRRRFGNPPGTATDGLVARALPAAPSGCASSPPTSLTTRRTARRI
jgi:AraC family transcriptional regulator, positive regulator of tynA and feaB